jgi:hypothetical protein
MRASLFVCLLLAACSSSSGGTTDEELLQAGATCKFAGKSVCGMDETGDVDAVLVCEVTDEAGRVWVLQHPCPFGCADAQCLLPPPDVVTDWKPYVDVVEVAEDTGPVCEPDCKDRICGDDGCGGSCGQCPPDHKCMEGKECVLYCEPKCAGKQCGPDGCGGSCGDCPFGMKCGSDGLCGCAPSCEGKECGPDGCGGVCGQCPPATDCSPFGKCEGACVPQCKGKQCGPDECGSTCGNCAPGLFCSPEGQCTTTCYPDCTGKQCGSDGCFGMCGVCPCPDCAPTMVECGPAGLCVQGLLSCNEMINCMAACPMGDIGCPTNCYLAASGKGQTLYDNLVECIIQECGDAPTEACQTDAINGVCFDDLIACIDDM